MIMPKCKYVTSPFLHFRFKVKYVKLFTSKSEHETKCVLNFIIMIFLIF
jgi:hypothetical protein